MARRKKKPPPRIIHLSPGALPTRLVADTAGRCLVFSDASCLRQGGLAAVFYASDAAAPQVVTRRVAAAGSNQLELHAALLALEQAALLFPGMPLALFSDNRDTVDRLNRAKMLGLAQDPELARLQPATGMFTVDTEIRWIPGHGSCRGNAEADRQARQAAS
ncbi:RNase H family protein [Azonexus fungiphilus]|uniref:RNase H family protein n=1 Tax=Azonexus fungiphilus TaxID=146940 RepID=UPI00156A99A7|nr:RNase H family protein [Azonexus fungiphilus]NHC07363.1 hypothetical protein [Azonexus fungiphilus]